MNDDTSRLNLYVVGELSGDPQTWSPWTLQRCLVVAHDEKEAIELCEVGGEVCLVDLSKPFVLSHA